jgi:ribonucleoside-diphosphate reductase alpha chain
MPSDFTITLVNIGCLILLPFFLLGVSKRGLPISCFLPYLDDSAEGLVNTLAEVNWLSMLGGGVGIGIGIRSADDKSVGVMPHLRTYDASSLAYRQGTNTPWQLCCLS